MWQVNVPLGEFYDAITEAGRRAHYLALLTALIRDGDSRSFYADITRYWDSLHDVTGPDFLFVLAGADASEKVGYHGVPAGREPVAYSSRSAAVVHAQERAIRPSLSHWAAQMGTPNSPNATELAGVQTSAIGQLRRRLGIAESRLPCFHLAFIGYERRQESVTIPLSARTVYESVKHIVSNLDEEFTAIRELTKRVDRLARVGDRKSRMSWYQPSRVDLSLEQAEAVRRIGDICATTPASPEGIAAARAECFRHLRVLKETSDFQPLQRHIDVHLDARGTMVRLGAKHQETSTEAALEAAWEAVFRAASRLTTSTEALEEKYRIFIAYESKQRWIAEYLHSALARYASTFLDVRCLRPGDRWVERIRAAEDNAELTVVLVGESGGTSWFQQAEYLRAIELARAGKQRLVPIYTNGAPTPTPYGLEGIQGIVTTWGSGLRVDEVGKTAAAIAELISRRKEEGRPTRQ